MSASMARQGATMAATAKIGSAGKIFSLTGWKVGFVCAAPEILRQVARAHQFVTFTTAPSPSAPSLDPAARRHLEVSQ